MPQSDAHDNVLQSHVEVNDRLLRQLVERAAGRSCQLSVRLPAVAILQVVSASELSLHCKECMLLLNVLDA